MPEKAMLERRLTTLCMGCMYGSIGGGAGRTGAMFRLYGLLLAIDAGGGGCECTLAASIETSELCDSCLECARLASAPFAGCFLIGLIDGVVAGRRVRKVPNSAGSLEMGGLLLDNSLSADFQKSAQDNQ